MDVYKIIRNDGTPIYLVNRAELRDERAAKIAGIITCVVLLSLTALIEHYHTRLVTGQSILRTDRYRKTILKFFSRGSLHGIPG